MSAGPVDRHQRPLRDLRISVTDRCNFRCPYCMPKEVFGPGYAFLRDPQLMSFDEVAEIARAFVALGVEKVRLTGGEPLLRADLPELVRVLKADLRVRDVALTTNGLGFSVDRVLAGIAAAEQVGLAIKINTVVQRGVNDHEIIPLAEHFRERGHPLRFIEFMDVGNTNHWDRAQVLPARDIVERIHARWPLEPIGPAYRGEVAARYRYVDGRGEIGLISSVTEPFCRDCHRARLSLGWDVLGAVRAGVRGPALEAFLARIWSGRMDRYSDERAELISRGEVRPKAEMSYLGG